MAEDFRLTGGCLCGAVRYTLRAPALESHFCHCSTCRKVHGAMFGAFSVVLRHKFSLDRGADNLTPYASSERLRRNFCKSCGCHIFDELVGNTSVLELATGTLDGGAHPGHPPASLRHIFVGSKVPWHAITDDLPQNQEF